MQGSWSNDDEATASVVPWVAVGLAVTLVVVILFTLSLGAVLLTNLV